MEIVHRDPPLRETIRKKILSGVLPPDPCPKGWFARGQGQPCAACGDVIDETQVECDGRFADGTTLRFHRPCFLIWNDERESHVS